MDLFFGWGKLFTKGSSPSVAMNANHDMAMVHNPSGHALAYQLGTQQRATVIWSVDQPYDRGREPSIAISNKYAVEIHRGEANERLYYLLGTLDGIITWIGSGDYDEGVTPTVAINNQGVVVEVHRSQNRDRLFYNIGLIDGTSIDWNGKDDFADGIQPTVAINNNGQGIVAYHRDMFVYYRLLKTDGRKMIELHAEHRIDATSGRPSIAVTDDNHFILCHPIGGSLIQRFGVIDGSTVSWGSPVEYDQGSLVAVAAQNGLAVQVHGHAGEEFFTTSLITDRSRWMSQRIDQLGPLPLRDLVLPGSHDAGMYGNAGSAGQTQDKTVHQQLTYGLRWFDFRVMYRLFDIYIHHGQEPVNAWGEKLTVVLDDIKNFLHNGSKELVILKFSHFEDFNTEVWSKMVKEINDRLRDWMFKGPLPSGKRLADLTLNDYRAQGCVLVVVDGNWAKDHPHEGFWVYRDASSDHAADGQLRVYDNYTKHPNDYEKMKEEQIQHFRTYDGKCGDATTDCDLFLLSWTMNVGTDVKSAARKPNQHLGDEVAQLPVKNDFEKIINILFVDYAQYARPSDVAIMQK